MHTHSIDNLDEISRTLLIPYYYRAQESQRLDALIRDPKAMELVDQLQYDFSRVQELKKEQIFYLLRMREFDRLAKAFLGEHAGGIIVDLGCGLDTRFERIDNGQAWWYGLDLPKVIELRKELLEETPRSHFIACSISGITLKSPSLVWAPTKSCGFSLSSPGWCVTSTTAWEKQ